MDSGLGAKVEERTRVSHGNSIMRNLNFYVDGLGPYSTGLPGFSESTEGVVVGKRDRGDGGER